MSDFDRKLKNRNSMDLGSLCRNCHKRIIKRNPIARFRTVLDDVLEKGFCSTSCQETYFQNRVKIQNASGVNSILRKNFAPPQNKRLSGSHKRNSARLKRNIPAPPPPVVSKVEFKREIERVVTTMRKEHGENRKKILSGFRDILTEVTKNQKNDVDFLKKQNEILKTNYEKLLKKNDEISSKIVDMKSSFGSEMGKINSRLEKIESSYNQKLAGKESELDKFRTSYEEYQVKILNSFKELLD